MDSTKEEDLSEAIKDITLSDDKDMTNDEEVSKVMDDIIDKIVPTAPIASDNISADTSPENSTSGLLRDKDSEAEDEALDNGKSDGVILDNNPKPKELVDKVVDGDEERQTKELPVDDIGNKFERKRNQRPRTEKWGESVGIVDESGQMRRVVAPHELHNYLVLELGLRTDFKLYSSLINERFPRFLDSTIDYLQRWRMRYNIFATNVLEDENDDSLVHVGEIHLYFDLIPKYKTPYYVNNTFYENPNKPEKAFDLQKYSRVLELVDRFRKTNTIFQLKFPIRGYLFHNTNDVFKKFEDRQQELMDESHSVYRKAFLRRRRNEENQMRSERPERPERSNSQSIRGPSSRYERNFGQNRDNFATNRRRPRNDRPMRSTNREFETNYRNDREQNEKQRAFDQNKRNGHNFRGHTTRVFRGGSNRRSNSRPNYKNSSIDDNEVMFEDTRERQERSARNTDKTPKRRDNKGDDKRMDNFQRESNFGRNRRNSGRSVESNMRNRFHEDLSGGYSSGLGPSVMAMSSNRQIQMPYGYGPNLLPHFTASH